MPKMNQYQKCQFLKTQIEYLYSQEGRSISFLSKLFEIQRYVISRKLKEWNTPKAKNKIHLTPSQQKFVNKNRSLIKTMLDNDATIQQIAEKIHCTKSQLECIYIPKDKTLHDANIKKTNRRHTKAMLAKESKAKNSSLQYNYPLIDNEIWKPILGYENYDVSNMGRIRSYSKEYDKNYLRKPWLSNDGYIRITLAANNKQKTLLVHRIVAQTFMAHDTNKNIVNHKDGNKQNNKLSNLEWVTASENNIHYYHETMQNKKTHSRKRKIFNQYIVFNNKKFFTLTELSKYMNISRTTLARHCKNPNLYGIELH